MYGRAKVVKSVISLTVGVLLLGEIQGSAQLTVSTNSIQDAFVRSAAPTNSYGAAGNLAVSGLVATNASGVQQGQFDSFLRFDSSTAVGQFNTTFGAGQWTITNVTLTLTELAAPANAVFNRGVGQFELRWIANDSWIEGNGTPMSPGTTGVKWNDKPTTLDSGLDQTLGTFVNLGANGSITFTLDLPASFLNDVSAGGLVSLFMTAPTNSTVGFTVISKDDTGGSSRWPTLSITAIPEPSTVALVGLSGLVLIVAHRRRRNDA
jgi:hypothetical protein